MNSYKTTCLFYSARCNLLICNKIFSHEKICSTIVQNQYLGNFGVFFWMLQLYLDIFGVLSVRVVATEKVWISSVEHTASQCNHLQLNNIEHEFTQIFTDTQSTATRTHTHPHMYRCISVCIHTIFVTILRSHYSHISWNAQNSQSDSKITSRWHFHLTKNWAGEPETALYKLHIRVEKMAIAKKGKTTTKAPATVIWFSGNLFMSLLLWGETNRQPPPMLIAATKSYKSNQATHKTTTNS